MADIVTTLADALGISTGALFQKALGKDSPEARAQYRSYTNRKEIPSPLLHYCKRLANSICSKCGADLTGTAKIVGKRDGIDLRGCYPECLPRQKIGAEKGVPGEQKTAPQTTTPSVLSPQAYFSPRRRGRWKPKGIKSTVWLTTEELRQQWEDELE